MNERTAVPFLVDHTEVNRIPFLQEGISRGDVDGCLVGVNSLSLTGGVLFRDQLGDGDIGNGRVSVVSGPVGKGQLLGFYEEVEVLGRIVSHLLDVVWLQKIQHFQCCNPLTVGWQFPDVVTTIVRRHRFDPFRLMV